MRGWLGLKSDGHVVACLDYANDKARAFCNSNRIPLIDSCGTLALRMLIEQAEIVLVHWYDQPNLLRLIESPLPACRLVFWCHKNYEFSQKELEYPDLFIRTSPVQGPGRYIWSTGDMSRFLAIKPKPHKEINVGYMGTVDYKKMHSRFIDMCGAVRADVNFIVIGRDNINKETATADSVNWKTVSSRLCYRIGNIEFVGQIDDIVPFLEVMDIFGYPLRRDHYGTCEQVLGEAMCAGVVPIVLDNPTERRIIQNGETGIVSSTLQEYVKQMEALVLVPRARQQLGANAKVMARKLYSIEHMIERWERVFGEVMSYPKRERG